MTRKENREKNLRESLRLHFEEGLGEVKISRILGVPSATIRYWINIFVKEKRHVGEMSRGKGKSKSEAASGAKGKPSCEATQAADMTQESLLRSKDERIKELERQLKYQTMRADAYDTMINIAERQLRIQIRKKAGAKQ